MIKTNKIGNIANTFEINTEDIANVQSTGMKNLIINGDFSIWQRGDSFTKTEYTADRWYSSGDQAISKGGYSNKYGQPLWASKGGNKSWQWIGQFIELPEYYKGKTVTISFKIKWNTFSPEAYLFVKWADGSTIDLGNNSMGENIGGWQTVSHTFVVPDDATDYSSFSIRFHGNAETGTMYYSFDLAQVQLELSSVATPFEQRPIGLELSLCQRYYEIGTCGGFSGNAANSSSQLVNPISDFKVTKRIVPHTVTHSVDNALNYPTTLIIAINYNSLWSDTPPIASSLYRVRGISWTADAEIY